MTEQAPTLGKEIVAIPEGDPMRKLFTDLSMRMRLLVGRSPLDPKDPATKLFEDLTIELCQRFIPQDENLELKEPKYFELPTGVQTYRVHEQSTLDFAKETLGAIELPPQSIQEQIVRSRRTGYRSKVSEEIIVLENFKGRKEIRHRTVYFNELTRKYEKLYKNFPFFPF